MELLHQKQIYTIDNILNNQECKKIIDKANKKGWNDSSPSGGGHGRTGREDPRTNSFAVYHDKDLADKILLTCP